LRSQRCGPCPVPAGSGLSTQQPRACRLGLLRARTGPPALSREGPVGRRLRGLFIAADSFARTREIRPPVHLRDATTEAARCSYPQQSVKTRMVSGLRPFHRGRRSGPGIPRSKEGSRRHARTFGALFHSAASICGSAARTARNWLHSSRQRIRAARRRCAISARRACRVRPITFIIRRENRR